MPKSPLILGIDPDTRSYTLCFMREGWYDFLRIEVKGRRADDRLPKLYQAAKQEFKDFQFEETPPAWVYVEGPIVGPNMAASLVQARSIGLVEAALMNVDARYSLVSNAIWKKETIGKGNATKEQIKAWALAHGVEDGLKQDFYDAYCIAVWGLRAFGGKE